MPNLKKTRKRATALKLDARNARKHSDRNRAAIRTSLDAVGAGRGVLADADGIIRAGNGVFQEWTERGGKVKVVETDGQTLLVTQRVDLKGKAAIRAAALDNLTADTSARDYDADILAEIMRGDDVVAQMVKDDSQIAALVRDAMKTEETGNPENLVDRAAELQKKWRVERGQLWEIPSKSVAGKAHRILCGDSTSAEDVARVMQGEKAQFVCVDPPYNMDYSGGGFSMAEIGSQFKERLKPLTNFDPSELFAILDLIEFGSATIWTNKELLPAYFALVKERGLMFNLFVWTKDNPPPFTSETFLPDVEYCIWIGNKSRHFTKGLEYKDYSKWFNSDIQKGKREGGGTHPTIKPLEFIARFVKCNCADGGVSLDAYLGSGTTLVACEQTGRIGRGLEIEERYVSVCLERLSLLGLTPRRVETNGKKQRNAKLAK